MTKETKLDVKIGTHDEALWTKVKKECEQLIENHRDSLKVQQALLELAKKKILEEQAK